jgi:hypothetical protein
MTVDRKNPYFEQVELLVRVLPVVGKSKCFTVKGGTAINLFYRDMPRLSVDIDLVYLPLKSREESLLDISKVFETDFIGMTVDPVDIGEIEKARRDLILLINQSLSREDKGFLVGFKEGNPDWSHFSVPHIQHLPAVKWKLHNLGRMKIADRRAMIDGLREFFGM